MYGGEGKKGGGWGGGWGGGGRVHPRYRRPRVKGHAARPGWTRVAKNDLQSRTSVRHLGATCSILRWSVKFLPQLSEPGLTPRSSRHRHPGDSDGSVAKGVQRAERDRRGRRWQRQRRPESTRMEGRGAQERTESRGLGRRTGDWRTRVSTSDPDKAVD